MATASELLIKEDATALEMALAIFGPGVNVTGASYTGDDLSSATYSGGLSTSPGVVPGDSGVILSTGLARDFTNTSGDPNTSASRTTDTVDGIDGDTAMDLAANADTFDASFLDVDFVPDGPTMSMRFVFSSDEFPEFVNSIYTDLVQVWVNGQPVPLAVGTEAIDVDNISPGSNSNLFISNTNDDFNTEMDGFTLTLSLTMNVSPGEMNSIRIGIADVSDSLYDSNLLIAADSVQTEFIAADDSLTIAPGAVKTIDVLANDQSVNPGIITITHINGQPVVANSSVLLPSGQTITLTSDGTLRVEADADTETVNFTYQAIDGAGVIDTAFVTLASVPCFVAGSLIRVPDGEVPVESLMRGDLVITQDDGPQPIRWIGTRTVAASGDHAPIRIDGGSLGTHRTLLVSPLHRILIRDTLAELLFGDGEVLVAARDLINGTSVRPQEGGDVTYVHIMFDRHQVVFAGGLATESFLPGPQTTDSFDPAAIDEIREVFPDLDPETGRGYGPAARRTLRPFEASLLFSRKIAA